VIGRVLAGLEGHMKRAVGSFLSECKNEQMSLSKETTTKHLDMKFQDGWKLSF